MTRRRAASIARGSGSLLLLGALLLGPPLALTSLVGWPLPTTIPDLSSFEQAVRSGISDDVIVKALALIAWLAWTQITVAIVSEAVAVVRGRPSVHLPVLPGIQATAGRLVASVAVMLASFSPAVAMAASPPPVPVVAVVALQTAVAPAPMWGPQPGAVDASRAPSPPVAAPTVTVERHDSFWAIAERTLGDGYRWREIRDLNVGRTMSTGNVVVAGSDLVLAGWVLDLPTDAIGGPDQPRPPSTAPIPTNEVTVEQGDNFWTLAEEQLATGTGHEPTDAETAAYWQTMIGANEDRLVKPGNPDLIETGQRLVIPPMPDVIPAGGSVAVPPPVIDGPPATKPATPATPSLSPTAESAPPVSVPVPTPTEAPAPSAQETPVGSVAPSPVAAQPDEPATESTEVPIAVIAASLASTALAVGATRTVRRRRRRAGHRVPGSVANPTGDGARELHHELVADADGAAVDDLRRCLGELAQSLAQVGATVRPRIVQHGPDHLDLFLDHPCQAAPRGWRADAEGAVWSIGEGGDHVPVDADPICAAPLLVTLGQPDDGGQLYLDLEAESVVALMGDPDTCRGVARAMLTELALTPLADTLEVIVVGDLAPPDTRNLGHVTLAASWDEVSGDLTAWARQSHEVLVENTWPNAFVARGHDPFHDALAPVVLVAAEPPPDDLLREVMTHRPATLALLVIGAIEGVTVIECQPESLTLVDLGLVCTPYPLEPEVLETIIDLIGSADDEGAESEGQLSLLPGSMLVEPYRAGPDPSLAEPEYDILVRALGDIRVEGGELLAPKQTAVVTYIALHEVVSADRLEDAVWASPTTNSRRKRLSNTISECRALLGRAHFPTASDGRYRTGPGLVTDLDLFDLRIKRAAEQPAIEAVETLLAALELVTGPLFTYRNADRASFAWVDVENWVSTWELKVAAVAQRCADLLLDVGRSDEAVDVALHALGILPTHTGLTETLMRAHAANGDRLAIQRVYQEHVGALQALDYDDAEESTVELRNRLLEARTG
jgi:DNA-binding SARP family transcriptional activator/nucleoid-associated protein YgaU